MLTRTPVNSSDIRTVAYDPKAELLEIEFHKGGVYQYFGVPQPVYDSLFLAESMGKYFARHIKGQYSYFKVPPEAQHTQG